MVKVITYGTYDLLHAGHIRLLERAKALGDYLIVGITADDYDKQRGKINVKQPLIERIEAVRATGLADEIIVEEYEGQKIDDIRRLNVDIFTVGSDWVGYFDYLNEYCKVIYLERTQGVSSSELRTESRKLRMGLVGESSVINKFESECKYVNGIELTSICAQSCYNLKPEIIDKYRICSDFDEMLNEVDSVYILSHPLRHYSQVKKALMQGKHVLCESPIALNRAECVELFDLAKKNHCILTEAIKTAYSTAYSRLLLLVQSGKIGKVLSVDATCTSLKNIHSMNEDLLSFEWSSLTAWAPTALLPVFQLLGTKYRNKHIVSHVLEEDPEFDTFTKIDFIYDDAVASIKVGKGVKSEGELVISGTEGYIYVPAPWWKTDYFELRYENSTDNKRYYYQLDGEGIRYEIVAFLKAIESNRNSFYISDKITSAISGIMEDFYEGKDVTYI